eukprot:767805-Hanusia_phi.AAC.2
MAAWSNSARQILSTACWSFAAGFLLERSQGKLPLVPKEWTSWARDGSSYATSMRICYQGHELAAGKVVVGKEVLPPVRRPSSS